MAIVRMQKVAVIAHRPLKERLLDLLQEIGALQIHEAKEEQPVNHVEMNFQAAEVDFAIETLKTVAPKPTLAALRKPSTPEDILLSARNTDTRGIIDALHRMEQKDTSAERRLGEVHAEMAVLSPWRNLTVPLHSPMETTRTIGLLGTVPEVQVEAFKQEVQTLIPRTAIEHVDEKEGTAYCNAIVWKEDRMRFEETATRFGWTSIYLPSLPGTAANLCTERKIEEKHLLEGKRKNDEERVRLSAQLPHLLNVRQFLRWLDAKQIAREATKEGFATVTLVGWLPKDAMQSLEKRLQTLSPAIAVMPLSFEEGEEPPVLLRNAKFLTPFESVTNLYGLPLPSEMDPTAPLAPFFALYFALCLTDAGYGLALTLIFGAVLWKTKKAVEESPLIWLLFFSGIASIFVGIPFGGWFGITPAQAPAFLTRTASDGSLLFLGQIWNLSAESGIQFLQYLALALGITHIFFGIFLAGFHKWVHGQKAAAFWEHFTSHIALGSVLFFFFAPASLKDIAQYALYAAIALMVWGKGYGSAWYLRPLFGVLGMVNFLIGLLSNSLSYLRLLALGLVTGAIALAVNQVAIEMSKLFPPLLGIPVMIAIALGGHLVSIALNALGSFIHSGRLQFIEFFGQFFEGGGRPYSPFRRSTS